MKRLLEFKNTMRALVLGTVVAASSIASVHAAPASKPTAQKSPSGWAVSGQQAKPAVEAGTKDAAKTASLGETKQVSVDASGKMAATSNTVSPMTGSVSGVDFSTFYNYCYRNLVYTTVYNSTSSTQYIHVMLYNQGGYRDYYTSIAAGGSYSYPAFYGVDGTYYAYLYVWNGSYYQYDEYKTSTNTCNVSVSRVYNYGGWVELKIQNYGTAYATQISQELAPYPGTGSYTGTQYDYPVAGGAAIYRWFYVGYSPYGITSTTYGSWNYPYSFYGDL